jgi:gamma-glutamyltranspeptidase/glutathione hydrolase
MNPNTSHCTPVGLLAGACLLLSACSARSPSTSTAASIEFPSAWPWSAQIEPLRAQNGIVASGAMAASEAGIEIMERGGNAVDAAIATHFALAVVHPTAGNIGGGGFMVVRMADGTSAALDFREKAPLASTPDMYLDENGDVGRVSTVGHLAVGVPGTPAGMWEAHQRFGTLDWAELVQPAIELAEGFATHAFLARSLGGAQGALSAFAGSAAAFLPGGEPPSQGDTFRQPDLAETLRRIAENGPDGFYRGRTADLLVAEMERGGGIIGHEDLQQYEAVWRDPVSFDYRGYTVMSMHPPSSGGATMAEIGNILEGWDLASMGWQSRDMIHLYAEASKRAFADRNSALADPDFRTLPLERMISQEYADTRRATITLDRATPAEEVTPGLSMSDTTGHTTHYSVVDADGNAVAVTTTLNSGYGSKVTVAGAGFLLNNEMDNFAAKPGFPNQYGLVQGEANAIEPGKRPLSSMSPSVVLDPAGELFFVSGTPGGPTIISTVFQTISNVIDYGMNVAQAINAPRLHHQHLPDQISIEADGLSADIIAGLELLGHLVVERGGYQGDAHAIMVMPDGSLEGYSDRRRGGGVAGR